MIVVRIKGGLGNQLFQYASAYSISRRLKQKLLIDNSFFSSQTLRGYKLQYLNIENKEISEKKDIFVAIYKNKFINKFMRIVGFSNLPISNGTYFLETKLELMDDFFSPSKDNLYLDGYFQSEGYFKEYRDDFIKQFSPNYTLEDEYLDELSKINNCESIAVHVRRGDFLKAQYDFTPFHYLLDESYYYNAIGYINNHIENPTFFWFSDDVEWVKSKFGERNNYQFVSLHTKHPDIDEMMLMKNCKHVVGANSTFSWWASWLNENENAMHICPSKCYGNKDMVPNSWIKIDIE